MANNLVRAWLGIAVGLVLAFPARSEPPARIDGKPITEGEVVELRKARESDSSRDQILEEIINRRLLARAARERGLDEDPEVQRRLIRNRRDILIRAIVDQLARERVPADAVRAFYRTHFSGQGQVSQVRLLRASRPTREGAERVDLDAADQPGSWHFRALLRDGLRRALPDEVQKGSEIGPVAGPDGWTVARVADKRRVAPPALSTVQTAIRSRLEEQALAELLEGLRRQARIEYSRSSSSDP